MRYVTAEKKEILELNNDAEKYSAVECVPVRFSLQVLSILDNILFHFFTLKIEASYRIVSYKYNSTISSPQEHHTSLTRNTVLCEQTSALILYKENCVSSIQYFNNHIM
jgi:hypothetical protein